MLSQGRYIVLLEGTQAEINDAEGILRNRRIQDWSVYGTMGSNTTYPSTGTGIV